MDTSAPDRRPRALSPRWWVTGRDGRVVVGQAPNPALFVWLAALVRRLIGLLVLAFQVPAVLLA